MSNSSYPTRLNTKTKLPSAHIPKRNPRPNASKTLSIAKDGEIYDRVEKIGQALEELEDRIQQLQASLDNLVAAGGSADGSGCLGGLFNCLF
ncbi:hypothetical protein Tco_1552304 [Tanacetum coccineum]